MKSSLRFATAGIDGFLKLFFEIIFSTLELIIAEVKIIQ
jgi:hypothetical protein